MIIIIINVLLLITYSSLHAQRYREHPREKSFESLPQFVIDTIETKKEGVRIVLYSNNMWEYVYDENFTNRINSNEWVKSNWDTTQIFAYKEIPFNALPSIVELKLIDDIDDFHPPIIGKVFSKYGPRGRRDHNGTDVPRPEGDPIYATFEGKVRYARYNPGGFGYLVIVRHTNGLETWYAHLSKLNVKLGDVVNTGEVVGFVGNTGRSRGNHLHFEMRYKDQSFDPEFLIDFESGMLRYEVFALEKAFFNINSRASEILEDDDEDYAMLGAMLANAADSAAHIVSNAEESIAKERAVLSQSRAVYHTVRSGDVLGRIALRYGVTISQICRLNNISRNSVIDLGQELRVR